MFNAIVFISICNVKTVFMLFHKHLDIFAKKCVSFVVKNLLTFYLQKRQNYMYLNLFLLKYL